VAEEDTMQNLTTKETENDNTKDHMLPDIENDTAANKNGEASKELTDEPKNVVAKSYKYGDVEKLVTGNIKNGTFSLYM